MMKRLIIGAGAAVLLSGCALEPFNPNDPWDYETVGKMQTVGTAFDAALQQEYVALADYEYGGRYSGGDWDSVRYYTGKARAAAEGVTPGPTDLATVDTGAYAPALEAARADLVSTLATGVTASNPLISAKAQASFDCWTEESAENRQAIRIEECRASFEEAMRILKGHPTGIHFATGSSALDSDALATIDGAASIYKMSLASERPVRLVVSGYTDTVGSAQANYALSQRRADAVTNALIQRGVPGTAIIQRAKGQSELAVPTGQGVANRVNRRVEILIER